VRSVLALIARRLGLALVTLLAVSLVIFWAVEFLPGDTATRILGQEATPERVAALRAELHLDDPPWVRYARWLGAFVQGDWGESLVSRTPASTASAGGRTARPVADIVLPRLENTLSLAAVSLALYVPLSLALGIATALLRERAIGTLLSTLVLIGTAIPEFVVGVLLLVAFAVALPIFPPLSLIDRATSLPEALYYLALPAVTLTIAMTAYAVRMMQASLVAVLASDYVRLATLKGLSRARVLARHAIPNALGPALRVTVLNVAWLIGGVVLVENIFTFPGVGQSLVDSIRLLDTPVIEAIALILATVYIVANLAADLVAIALNPRLRRS
jgi:peptide/nickel transport system permease protein